MENFDISFPGLGLGIEHLKSGIDIFGFRIAFYGMIIAFGMLMGTLAATIDYKRKGFSPDDTEDLALYGCVSGVVGARIYYVLFEWEYYSKHLSEIINLRNGGLAIYGGVIAAVLCTVIFCRIRKIPFLRLGDSGVLGLLTGQMIGRWGNFFNCEAFGGYSDGLLRMRIREELINPSMLNEDLISKMETLPTGNFVSVHPTFLYESVWNLLGLIILFTYSGLKRNEKPGKVFALYFLWYGTGRFFIEGLRTDSLMLFNTGLRVSRLVSLLAIAGSLIFLFILGRKNEASQ